MAESKDTGALFLARMEDHLAKAARGEIAVSGFFTPGERKAAERFLKSWGVSEQAIFWGGYVGAERECLFLVPAFYLDFPDWMPAKGEDPLQKLSGGERVGVCAMRIKGSGFRTLTHRDYLGSILGLGIERDAMGDIAVQNESEAIVFCTESIARFLSETLTKVANDKVTCMPYRMDASFTDGRVYKPISDTVASPRLDCVVAALTNQSREEAQRAIKSGFVDVDFEVEERTDRWLLPPVTLSIRGYGRYVLRAFDGETRKGRLRLRADQLV